MIKICNGSYDYKESFGVKDINIEINKGDFICLMGPNGSGKSTLLKIIVGIYVLNTGKYFFNDKLIDHNYLRDSKKASQLYKDIGFVFQNSTIQLFNMSVYDEVAFGLKNIDLSNDEVETRVFDCLTLLNIQKLKDKVPYHLSGGEQKLVAIASVLAMNPQVILLDEPFSGLSPRYQKLIFDVICELKSFGKTIILTSHNFREINNIFDRIFIFSEEHTIVKELKYQNIKDNPEILNYLDNL
ncbi:energy-coupling factor ABC transporter ATP-binding protein [Enterococcus hirae]